MEAIVFGAITTIWWLASMSVLLPFILLLKFSKFLRDRWFSWFFVNAVSPYFSPKMLPLRKKAFSFLQEHLPSSQNSQKLEVLEIGIGSGANLQFYPENFNLTALDMNESFEKYFLQNLKKHSQVKFSRTVVAFAEDMKGVEDNSMDLVVCTYVLCSVESVSKVLEEVIRVLKPGGKFLFLEHVGFTNSLWSLLIQSYAAPLWNLYFNGCKVNRHTAEIIKKAKFSNVVCENIFPDSLIMLIRPIIYGIATK